MKRKASLFLIFILLSMFTVVCSKTTDNLSAAELLDLGEKYLLELDYEQAAVYFTNLIDVEPMNPRGYTGLAEAYLGMGESDKAISILRTGLDALLENDEIQAMLDELETSKDETSSSSVDSASVPLPTSGTESATDSLSDEHEHKQLMQELANAALATDYKAALDLVLDNYDEINNLRTEKLSNAEVWFYNVDLGDDGIGTISFGEYNIINYHYKQGDSQNGISYDLFVDDVGSYIESHLIVAPYSNGEVNGLCHIYQFNYDNIGTEYEDEMLHTRIGNVINGLYDGEWRHESFTLNEDSNASDPYHESIVTYNSGKVVILGEDESGIWIGKDPETLELNSRSSASSAEEKERIHEIRP